MEVAAMSDQLPNGTGDEPCYIISVAAKLVGMHPQTLRYYERLNLVSPARSEGKIRLYSIRDVQRLQQIHQYVSDLGVNLAGVEVILRLTERMAEMERQTDLIQRRLLAEIRRLRQEVGEPVDGELIPPEADSTGDPER
jgi:MerR family transcriptional regulator/heat shock protein HspR